MTHDARARPIAGFVLAAGLGTRLRPMTLELPKPAVPVANRPLASFSIEALHGFGAEKIALNTHHLAEELEREIEGAAIGEGAELTFHREATLLGTGGGIRNAAAEFAAAGRDVIVMNGDILFAPDLTSALALHRRRDAVATMVLRSHPDPDSLGSLEIDGESVVRRMLGRPEAVDAALSKYMFTGAHILSPRAFEDLPAEGCVIRHAYRKWVDEGAVVAGFVDDSPWRDLGTAEAYLDANLDLASGRLRWPGIEPSESGSLIDATASIAEGAQLEECVVGPGARIDAGISLSRTVVWANARVRASARESIITPEHRVQVERA